MVDLLVKTAQQVFDFEHFLVGLFPERLLDRHLNIGIAVETAKKTGMPFSEIFDFSEE